MERKKILRYAWIVVLLGILAGCGRDVFGFIVEEKSAWEKYSQKLDDSGLRETRIGKAWYVAGAQALINTPETETPFSSKGMFRAKNVRALGWQFRAKRGESLRFILKFSGLETGVLFADIFEAGDEPQRIAWFTSEDSIYSHEFKRSGSYLLRVQPELFAEGNVSLSVERIATYAVFPVYGKNSSAVRSFWGAPRGAGGRKHEGIDIFAARGTPVLAPVRGIVSSVRNRGLGGKQVWLRDTERGFSLYFAHLDSQLVSFGERVDPGDTLGLVGNTGNAKYTLPHLHFGIYSGGAFDPFPMVDDLHEKPGRSELPVDDLFKRIGAATANFREGPSTRYPVISSFPLNTPLVLLGAQENWYLVETPNKERGFVHASLVSGTAENKISADSLWVFQDPYRSLSDSLWIGGDLYSVGFHNGFEMLTDTAGNVFFRRTG